MRVHIYQPTKRRITTNLNGCEIKYKKEYVHILYIYIYNIIQIIHSFIINASDVGLSIVKMGREK